MIKTYIGTKIVKAKAMTLGDYNKLKGWDIHSENPNLEGYLVQEIDIYISWAPKEQFELDYREITANEAKLIVGDGNVFVVDQDPVRRKILKEGLEEEAP